MTYHVSKTGKLNPTTAVAATTTTTISMLLLSAQLRNVKYSAVRNYCYFVLVISVNMTHYLFTSVFSI